MVVTQEIGEWLCRISRVFHPHVSLRPFAGVELLTGTGRKYGKPKMRASSSSSREKTTKNTKKILSFLSLVFHRSVFINVICWCLSLLSLNFLVWGGERGILPSPFSNGFNANTNIIEKVPFFFKYK